MCVFSYEETLVYYPNVKVTEGKILHYYGSDLRSGYFG